jgi:hypothetical protein
VNFLIEGIAGQRRCNHNIPFSATAQRAGRLTTFGLAIVTMGADSWGSGGTAYSPLSVVQMVLFTDVMEVQQQRRCGGGEISTSYKSILKILVSYS